MDLLRDVADAFEDDPVCDADADTFSLLDMVAENEALRNKRAGANESWENDEKSQSFNGTVIVQRISKRHYECTHNQSNGI